jgi:hypothetical protein
MHKSPWRLLALLLVIGLVMPSMVIFALETSLGHKPPAQALAEIARRQFAEGHNLFLLAAIGLLPFFVLDAVILLVQALAHDRLRLPWIGWGGLSGILALMIPMHVLVWLPLYTNQRVLDGGDCILLYPGVLPRHDGGWLGPWWSGLSLFSTIAR